MTDSNASSLKHFLLATFFLMVLLPVGVYFSVIDMVDSGIDIFTHYFVFFTAPFILCAYVLLRFLRGRQIDVEIVLSLTLVSVAVFFALS